MSMTHRNECEMVLNGSLTTTVKPPYPSNSLVVRLAHDALSYHNILEERKGEVVGNLAPPYVNGPLLDCPFCKGKARPEQDAPWDETGYTHCLNPECLSVKSNLDGEPWRVPIPLWQRLPRMV